MKETSLKLGVWCPETRQKEREPHTCAVLFIFIKRGSNLCNRWLLSKDRHPIHAAAVYRRVQIAQQAQVVAGPGRRFPCTENVLTHPVSGLLLPTTWQYAILSGTQHPDNLASFSGVKSYG